MSEGEWISLSVSIVGTAASVIAAFQAKSARVAAEQARDGVRARRTQSELAVLSTKLKDAVAAMAKYGPGASLSSLAGVTIADDVKLVRRVLIERDGDEFDATELERALEKFGDAERPEDVRRHGGDVFRCLCDFQRAVAKSVRDAEYASSSEAGQVLAATR